MNIESSSPQGGEQSVAYRVALLAALPPRTNVSAPSVSRTARYRNKILGILASEERSGKEEGLRRPPVLKSGEPRKG